MALIRIEIEQVNARQFNAHVEVGFPQSRRKGPSEGLRFGTLAEAFRACWDVVHELGKEEVPLLVLGPSPADLWAQSGGEVIDSSEIENRQPVKFIPRDDPRGDAEHFVSAEIYALRSEAEAAGIKVDRRWGEARLREEIEKAGAHE